MLVYLVLRIFLGQKQIDPSNIPVENSNVCNYFFAKNPFQNVTGKKRSLPFVQV